MIKKIFIIKASGVLCYSKTFFSDERIDEDFISGFFTAISNIAQEIGGGEIRSLNFRNFNIVFTFDYEKNWIFIIVTNIDDDEEEVRYKLESLKLEFFKRYRQELKNWDYDIGKFESFDAYIEKYIFIPPKILLVGEAGVGKTTIMDYFPGETIIRLDEDMNDILQKSMVLPNFKDIYEIIIREIDLQDLVDNLKTYKQLLDSVDIICVVTNSGGPNLNKTKKLFSFLEPKVKKADFYIFANFQDFKNTAYTPEKIEEFFRVKTYGMSAISRNFRKQIHGIIIDIVDKSIVQKYYVPKKVIDKPKIKEDNDITIILD